MTEERLLEIIAKTFEGIAELREEQKKTDEQIKQTFEGIAQLREENKRTEEMMNRTFEEMRLSQAKSDKKLDKVAKLVGGMSNNQGDVAEEFFYNSLKHKQELAGIHYDRVEKNITASANKVEDEFDIVMINGSDVAIIEVKYKAHEKDLEKLLTKKYTNFQKLYPMYKDYKHHLGLASFYINDNLKEIALSKGVMILQRKGDIVETYTPYN